MNALAQTTTLARSMPWPELDPQAETRDIPAEPLPERLLQREWLISNGLGGYASGTLAGVPTRRYHGLLVAALPAPVGRIFMLGQIEEVLRLPDGTILRLGGEQKVGQPAYVPGAGHLREFRLEWGLPVWTYEVAGFRLEKRVFLGHLQNTVHVTYRLATGDGGLRLELHPTVHFRPHDAPVSTPLGPPYTLTAVENRYELCSSWPNLPSLRLSIQGRNPTFTVVPRKIEDVYYDVEARRGYESVGDLWSPGFFGIDLEAGEEDEASLIASTETWEVVKALKSREAFSAEMERRRRLIYNADPRAHHGTAAELVLAADTFVVTPGRSEDAARAHASGDEARSIIAGYHWFTDWGRDTMISLEGLTLTTGRQLEAGYILRTFARYVKDGLIPNFFPDGDKEGLYHTADATLWFFHALHRYLEATNDRETLRLLLPKLLDIVDHHLQGTLFGIGIDPRDGLFRQGAEGYQLTWMDAKVGDWVVTPRRGKAVEINALWYNALRLLERWTREEIGEDAARPLQEQADLTQRSFNARFWNPDEGYLYDVLDGESGNDPACRPNQLFAISLDNPVLDPEYWTPVLEIVTQRLLTPLGLRTLAPGHPDYKPMYYGDLRARDAAYHQGTVWAWLIGPFIDSWLKVHPDDFEQAQQFLMGFVAHLGEACMGSISEIFDAEAPYTPRGCIAQAWSVAEV
ncbi:MAG TPA: amylo-alpha-1,6-glucosidase, partial [Thermoanaerobaculia bacterium]|nr:amylo-alpha-1,6-glucosidase [Thermoanaerobaculia bacterium]